MTLPILLLVLAFVPMAFEARLSRANEQALRAAGAREPPGDVYGLMRIAYPVCFGAMVLEAWLRGSRFTPAFAAGAVLFAAAKALKYWAIASLGPRWAFRVLVPRRVIPRLIGTVPSPAPPQLCGCSGRNSRHGAHGSGAAQRHRRPHHVRHAVVRANSGRRGRALSDAQGVAFRRLIIEAVPCDSRCHAIVSPSCCRHSS